MSYNCRHLYDDAPVSRTMLRQRVDYVHINAVKHGHATHAALWPHSSFGRYVREGIYPADWCGPVEDVELRWE